MSRISCISRWVLTVLTEGERAKPTPSVLDSATLRPPACLEPQSCSLYPVHSIPAPGGEASSPTLQPVPLPYELVWWGLRGTWLA